MVRVLEILPYYILFGGMVGFLAGLLGVGGAILLVPIMHFTLEKQGVDPSLIHHMAIATTMANILFTSSMATYSHHKRGAVPWKIVAWMVPGIMAGAFAGSFLTGYIPSDPLALAFGIFLIYAGAQTFVDIKPKASRHMPGIPGQLAFGALIGMFSGIMGVGGAAVTVPILLVCGLPVLNTIATSGAFGFPIAIAGCVGYALTAWGHPNLPEYSLGFIYLPALLGFVPTSVLCAPLGVKVSHILPPKILRRGFGVLVLIMAYRMISRALD